MSELTATTRRTRHHLLTGVCAAAMLSLLNTEVAAREVGHPTIWIELGGQLERESGLGTPFAPAFTHDHADSQAFDPVSPVEAQRSPRYSKGLEGKLILSPEDSDWAFSAAIRYGRSNGNKRVHQQTPGRTIPPGYLLHGYTAFDPAAPKAVLDARSKERASHTVLDFKAGRDVGLGILGRDAQQLFSFGVRFAQFTSSKSADLKGRPEIGFTGSAPLKYWTNFIATGQSWRNFQGLGPSISLEGSAPLTGNADEGIALDWGLGGSVLFGRQKASVLHQTYASRHVGFISYEQLYQNAPPRSVRNRSVVVPNVNAFASLSFRRSNARISFGYRGDFFFGAMDTGMDVRHSQNVGFHGPFAKISIGLGG